MPDEDSPDVEKTRQERREERLQKRRAKIRQHGRILAQIYRNAIRKRLKNLSSPKK